MPVPFALLALTFQQAVERAGQAQQLARVFFTQAGTGACLHLIQFGAKPAQATKAPGQTKPQQPQQYQQRATEPEVELAHKAVVHGLIIAGRLHGHHAEGRALPAQQVDFYVVDKELVALSIGDAHKLVTTAVVAWAIVDAFIQGGTRLPDQRALTVVDKAQQLGFQSVKSSSR